MVAVQFFFIVCSAIGGVGLAGGPVQNMGHLDVIPEKINQMTLDLVLPRWLVDQATDGLLPAEPSPTLTASQGIMLRKRLLVSCSATDSCEWMRNETFISTDQVRVLTQCQFRNEPVCFRFPLFDHSPESFLISGRVRKGEEWQYLAVTADKRLFWVDQFGEVSRNPPKSYNWIIFAFFVVLLVAMTLVIKWVQNRLSR